VAASYGEILARNMRAARGRQGLEQEQLAARMRSLGLTAWRRQTVAAVERSRRRLTAEEVFRLAMALDTTVVTLMSPTRDDRAVELPGSGLPDLPVVVSASIVVGDNLGWVTWPDNDDKAVFSDRPDVNVAEVLRNMGPDARGRLG
jgi:transcriptional regulator with XRE-family HTH domain